MPPLIIAAEAVAAGGAEGAAVGAAAEAGAGTVAAEEAVGASAAAENTAAAEEEAAADEAADERQARARDWRRRVQEQTRSRREQHERQEDSNNENRVNPLAWLFFVIALICDLAKIPVFFLQVIPFAGIPLSVVLSLYISAVEVIIVFGGLWAIGLYKSPVTSNTFFLVTLGVSAADLVPEIDDFPFTSPTVFFMIVKAYAANGGTLGTLLNIGTKVAGAASAIGGVAGKAAGAARGGFGSGAMPRPSSPASASLRSPVGRSPSAQSQVTKHPSAGTGAGANDNLGGTHNKQTTPLRTRAGMRPPPASNPNRDLSNDPYAVPRNKYGMRLPPESQPARNPEEPVRVRGRGR